MSKLINMNGLSPRSCKTKKKEEQKEKEVVREMFNLEETNSTPTTSVQSEVENIRKDARAALNEGGVTSFINFHHQMKKIQPTEILNLVFHSCCLSPKKFSTPWGVYRHLRRTHGIEDSKLISSTTSLPKDPQTAKENLRVDEKVPEIDEGLNDEDTNWVGIFPRIKDIEQNKKTCEEEIKEAPLPSEQQVRDCLKRGWVHYVKLFSPEYKIGDNVSDRMMSHLFYVVETYSGVAEIVAEAFQELFKNHDISESYGEPINLTTLSNISKNIKNTPICTHYKSDLKTSLGKFTV